jgi:PAS domain S-box-containing protein
MTTHAAKVTPAASDLVALFRALEDLPAAAHVVAVDPEHTFPFVAVNRAAEELMELPRHRIVGTPLAHFTTVQQAGRDAFAAHRDVAETGRPRTYRTSIGHLEGATVVQCTLAPLHDDLGQVSHILGVDCEVTADVRSRVETEAELRRAHDHAESLLAALRDGVVEMDLDQQIVAVNDRFCQIIGRPRREVLGLRPPLPWWDPDDVDGASNSWSHHFGEGAVDMTYVLPDGRRLPVSVSVAVVLDADAQPSGWIGLVRDVSGRARTQQELQIRAHADALVARASTRLLSAPAGQVGEVVRSALGQFCKLVRADHAALWQVEGTEGRFRRAHTWSHPGIGDTIEGSAAVVAADDMPWAEAQSGTGQQTSFRPRRRRAPGGGRRRARGVHTARNPVTRLHHHRPRRSAARSGHGRLGP